MNERQHADAENADVFVLFKKNLKTSADPEPES